eukprot:CAMPEP_0114576184 /NCGR_PEP_ID=MMETSP0125-20121206/975_1 /TAXON_ID=485358 ORGANISM="Aristerostoma sp., Strain ATCC 50986" /NCGR_SAMPLE_ID=MMETSP0125 /ASSEMBLY_ACC=CAM_ASM_000245 /LENGTH=154 /DNA_ID=CAMNT_0001764503 /DNA_START=930 /DNA_END=1394 /DNA_ORIENTATION=-
MNAEKVVEVGGDQWPSLKFANQSIAHFLQNGYILENPDGTFVINQFLDVTSASFYFFPDEKNPNIRYGQILNHTSSSKEANKDTTQTVYVFDGDASTVEQHQFDGYGIYNSIQKVQGSNSFIYTYSDCIVEQTVEHFIINNQGNVTDLLVEVGC